MYAIVRTGGKQYRVEEGRTIQVERLPNEEGSTVELHDVLLIADDGDVTVGSPTIDGARVLADVESHGRAKKIVVFKYKAKVRTRKKTGHRQHLTRLAVTEILRPGEESKAAKPKRRRATKRAAKKEEAPEEATAEATVATEEKPAPKRRARKPAASKAEAKTPAAEGEKPAPKRRARKPAASKAEAKTPTAEGEKAAPKRRARKPAASKASAKDKTAEKKPARKRTPRAKAPEKKDEE